MKVTDLGEFGLIGRLMRSLEGRGGRVAVGIGDDAAVLETSPGRVVVAACDMMIEGVHFLRELATPDQIGAKAMGMNLSDLAAMNAAPLAALVSVGLIPDLEMAFVDGLYDGLSRMASRYGCPIVGGDTVRSPSSIIVDVFVIGEADRDCVTVRSGAQPGDVLLVTGTIGSSAAGLDLLLARRDGCGGLAAITDSAAVEVVRAHLEPVPRLPESRAIAAAGGATAVIDISDGLSNEVHHIAEMSGVGMIVDASSIPLSGAAVEVARVLGKDPLHYALYGGEDFELCFTAASRNAGAVARRVRETTGTRVTPIGRVVHGTGCRIERDGRLEDLPARAFDHFRQAGL